MPDAGEDDEEEELVEPLTALAAGKLVKEILKEGKFSFSKHAQKELANDKLDMVDAANVLRGGVTRAGECENGTWRYKVETQYIAVVVAFRSKTELRVVTAWRKKR